MHLHCPKNLTAALFLRKGRRTHSGEEERAIQRNIDRSDKKNNSDKDEPGVMQAGGSAGSGGGSRSINPVRILAYSRSIASAFALCRSRQRCAPFS
jgi:hypothetical protein